MCSDLPAVQINPHIIHHRNQHTNICHSASQIVPTYVHVGEHAYKRSASTENHCYHVDSVNIRYFLHLKRNSRQSKEENNRAETTLYQSFCFPLFAFHVEIMFQKQN